MLGFQQERKKKGSDEHTKGVIESALKKAFAPEFLNRIDDVVVFNSLTKENIHQIIDIELESVIERIEGLGYKINISTDAKDFIAEKGFDPDFGARPLKRAIQKYLEDPLAEEIIKSKINEGDTIKVGFNSDKKEISISISKPRKSKKTESEGEE